MIPYLNKGQGNILMTKTETKKDNSEIIHNSEIMKTLIKMINKVAPTDSSILIYGKSGTGKEVITKLIHAKSYRVNKPFTIINCSCLNENTIESELFGHEKGAFTGASRQKIGLLEKANNGTLVLDEISDLTLKTQSKLLRLLQEKEIYRVGGNIPIQLNLRVICCTNKNLAKKVIEGSFREDLYYRINTITITVPSLSNRPDDIPVLLKHFLGHNIEITPSALSILLNYSWPGNVRELQNLCERLRILQSDNVIKASNLPGEFTAHANKNTIAYDPSISLAALNKTHILQALEHFPSKKKAAQALGITVKTLYNRLHEYDEFKNFALHTIR